MSLGSVLDVIIGLAFIYLLLGILSSGAQELFAALSSKRSRELKKAIAHLLQGGKGDAGELLFEKVFEHGLVGRLSPTGKPSYVSARNFGLALTDALRDGSSRDPLFCQVERSIEKLPSGPLQETLGVLVQRAAGDLEALQRGIEVWFDDAMDRVSGIYKRFSQYFNLLFGLAAAVLLNVDSIALAQSLWADRALREVSVGLAQKYVDQQAGNPAADLTKRMAVAKASLVELNLPIGWTPSARQETSALAWIVRLAGWLITALAASVGAPFWFDSLQRLLNLRTAGPKPARAEKD